MTSVRVTSRFVLIRSHAFLFVAGLCPDWAEWDPNEPVQNAREAMQQADDWLGVPQVRHIIGVSREDQLSSG